jgi:hypothetical protein
VKKLTEITQIEESLWDIIDDIDTALDMTKGNYEEFFKYTSEKVKERFKYIRSDDGHTLTKVFGDSV